LNSFFLALIAQNIVHSPTKQVIPSYDDANIMRSKFIIAKYCESECEEVAVAGAFFF
jgi:hypothetical protein